VKAIAFRKMIDLIPNLELDHVLHDEDHLLDVTSSRYRYSLLG